MKTLRLAAFLLALFGALVLPTRSQARDAMSFDFFYDSLSPYGDWVEVDDYGLCWEPRGMDPNWSPYTDGYWAYTDAGWTWVSYEDFGGIVYHYGRWLRLEEGRWCWVPDYEWAPAWVSWRSSDDYVGWAPLPPWAHWRRDVGISIWADREYDLGPGYYRFCHTHDFGAPVLRAVMVDPGHNFTIMLGTTNVTNITYNMDYAGGPVIFDGGPDIAVINRFSARRIPTLRLVQNTNLDPAALHGSRGALAARTVGNQLVVAAPLVAPPTNPAALASRAKRVIAGVNVSKGWNMVPNPDAQRQLREQIQRQTKGLTPATAPARAVTEAALHSVPHAQASPAANAGSTEGSRDRDRTPHAESQTPPAATAGGVNLKPFNTSPSEAGANRAESQHSQDQEKMRAEQARGVQEKAQQEQARQQEAAKVKEAARSQADDARRREEERRAMEERHAKETAPQQNGRGNPPSNSEGSPRSGNSGHSKDSKDSKDKDKDKDRNGN